MKDKKELQHFYRDTTIKDAFRDFQIECLKEIASEKSFKGESTDGIKEARDAILSSYSKLDAEFGVKKQKKNNPR